MRGGCTLDDAYENTKIHTRRFAKQQRTWLKRYRHVHWLDTTDTPLDALLTEALAIVKQADRV